MADHRIERGTAPQPAHGGCAPGRADAPGRGRDPVTWSRSGGIVGPGRAAATTRRGKRTAWVLAGYRHTTGDYGDDRAQNLAPDLADRDQVVADADRGRGCLVTVRRGPDRVVPLFFAGDGGARFAIRGQGPAGGRVDP